MNWRPLISCESGSFWRGVVFRFPAKHPFEDIVDFMIIEERESPTAFKLICSFGYHSGQTELVFPAEAKHECGGVSVAWLVENWTKWIYPGCGVESVKYVDCYPSNHGATT
ncbi:Imm45 family immunity protein [Stutzerimonas nitrititolerans]|uniref:Imm45 family immunity protein n=1 Tax=Stutzerimonas nitrititolerans TaxID=2482751 RepID=UPI0035E451DE